MIYVQSGILIALHCIGNAHGLHQRIPHGVQHLLQLFPALSQHRFIELSALLHGSKQRAHIHAGDSGLIAVVILLRALERFQLHAHGCADVLDAHLFHLLGSLAVLLLGLQHLAEAVLTHHGHLVIHQHRHQQIAVQLLPLFLGDRVLLPVLIAGLLIDLLPLLLFCFRHKNLHGVIFLRSDLLRQDMFHTLVLNAHINDVRCVLRQRQVAKRLHHQQQHNEKHRFPVGLQVLKQLSHAFALLLSSSLPALPLPPYGAAGAASSAVLPLLE